jgi:aryl-alcohol dehydrogenase-like predicted oxidoreductase
LENALKYVNLGSTGLRVSRVCLGMMSYGDNSDRPWVLDTQAAEPIVKAAADAGITFYDTADAYSGGASEVATGQLLGKLFSRDDVVVATKVFFPVVAGDRGQGYPEPANGRGENSRGLSRKHIMSAIDASLRRLNMDYVDLYQIHRWDYRTPIEETMEALHDVVRAGKARFIGASSMFAWQFAKARHVADKHGWSRFVSMQNHYNLLYREEEREMIPQCIDQGVAVIPWSPLARGLLTGTRTRGGERRTTRAQTDSFGDTLYDSPGDFDVVDRVQEVAGERGVPAAQVALAWLLHRPGVTAPIVGATKLSHLEDAVAAEELDLSEEEMRRLEEPYQPHGVRGHQ